MAQEPETEKNASGIAHAAKRKWGYDAEQVDAFLERAHMLYEGEGAQLTQHDIQNVSFELVKGGYVIAQVDAALAVWNVPWSTSRPRGKSPSMAVWHGRRRPRTCSRSSTRMPNASTANGSSRARGKNPSYDRKQVDSVIDKCLTKAAGELGVEEVSEADAKAVADTNSQTLSNVIFTQRKGKRGYDERQVDYYLAACAQLLTRLESYARVADFVGEPSEEAMAAAAPSVAPASSDSAAGETQMIAPLFAAPSATVPAAPVPPTVPTVTPGEEDSFDALNKAEHEIFTSAVTSPVSVPATPTNTPPAAPVVPPVFQPQTDSASSAPSAVEETQAFDPLADDAMEDAAPKTPAPTTTDSQAPAAPAFPPAPVEPEPQQDPSLAALAHLAHTINETNQTENTFTPQVPSLSASDLPQVTTGSTSLSSLAASVPPSFTPEPSAPAEPAAEPAVAPAAEPSAEPDADKQQEDKKPEPSPASGRFSLRRATTTISIFRICRSRPSSEPTVRNRLAESSACSRVYTIPTTQPRLHSPNLHSPNQCRNIGRSYGEQRITHATINRSNSGLHRVHRHPRP